LRGHRPSAARLGEDPAVEGAWVCRAGSG
jgi:hypothetical protein